MLLSEVPQIFQNDLQIITNYLISLGIEEIYLFGSIPRNTATDKSDIDIAVRGIKPENYFQVLGELLMRTKHKIDLVDLNLQESLGNSLIDSGELVRLQF